VTTPGFTGRFRSPSFAVVTVAILLSAPASASAAFCHVSDRPVLAQTLTWEEWMGPSVPHPTRAVDVAPRALVTVPCQAQLPGAPSPSGGLANDAAIFDAASPPEPNSPGLPLDQNSPLAASPLPARLDRPPRTS
jgi:hypothetical protein